MKPWPYPKALSLPSFGASRMDHYIFVIYYHAINESILDLLYGMKICYLQSKNKIDHPDSATSQKVMVYHGMGVLAPSVKAIHTSVMAALTPKTTLRSTSNIWPQFPRVSSIFNQDNVTPPVTKACYKSMAVEESPCTGLCTELWKYKHL